jgi:hypothetical protein
MTYVLAREQDPGDLREGDPKRGRMSEKEIQREGYD